MSVLQKYFKEAMWWEKDDKGNIICRLCPRNCILSKDGQVGACGIRVRYNGRLYLATYGLVSSMALDPIEKKPLFHFYPGSCAFSISNIGCNLFCIFCQNWHISQARVSPKRFSIPVPMEEASPEELVKFAKANKCSSIAYTYNEPIVWYEYMLDTAKLARKNGVFNVLVTNGYINPEPAEELAKYLDAANVDLKGDVRFYKKLAFAVKAPEAVMETIKLFVEKGVFVEVTYLVVPRWNDSEEVMKKIFGWIYDEFGGERVPLHISRFYPHYKMRNVPPTPIRTLNKAYELAKEIGLKYVYIGNVPGHEGEHTYCPRCGRPVIKRRGFEIIEWNLDEENRCKFCGYKINIRGKYKPERSWIHFWF